MCEQSIISIILAAGKGTRMNMPDMHKVCTVLDGKTVLERAVETYAACGVNRHLLVVGQMAEQVMQTASSLRSNILYCYQASQRGTGHATKIAANLLASLNYTGDVLVVAGDKIIDKTFLQEFIGQFYARDCDLLLATGKANHYPASGRIVRSPSGSPLGIVEVFDIAKVKILNILKTRTRLNEISAEEIKQIVLEELQDDKKAALALGDLWKIIQAGKPINDYLLKKYFTARDFTYQINSIEIPLAQLENASSANLSVYLFKAGALFYAVNQIGSDNAQNEEYLTDVVKTLARGDAKTETMEVKSPEQIMAFNTPEELKNIKHALKEKRIKVEEHQPGGRRPSEWLAALKSANAQVQHGFASLYGQESELIEEKKKRLIEMLDKYLADFGDDPVIISRAPGRLNIMGRHIDHQGGYGNMIALEKDVYAAIGRRKDDRNVIMRNIQSDRFPDREFSIDSILNPLATKDWFQFVNSDFVMDTIRKMKGDWSNYAKAAIARFQALFPNRPFQGMNIVLSGDIPIAAGLSSSSALFVSIAEGVVELNQLNIASQQFVELCGEGEWYVGTRGGAGDHAAMKLAQKGQLVQLGFFPLLLAKKWGFPKIICLLFAILTSKRKKRMAQEMFLINALHAIILAKSF
ncbi:MAG: NTP transferase domain-containing protein [Calditrichaeota bacterium]|nr:NTP transferase domain-containing protein [Calditrichota bacterium]